MSTDDFAAEWVQEGTRYVVRGECGGCAVRLTCQVLSLSGRWWWLASVELVEWEERLWVTMQEGNVCEGLAEAQGEAERRVAGLMAAVFEYVRRGVTA